MHGIQYDEIHDEIFVNQPFAHAVLTFRGGANGEEPPIRVLQGPLTQIANASTLTIDQINNEILIPQGNALLVFPREANGNVAPIRILKGPDALGGVGSVAVDPVHNVLLASGRSAAGEEGVMIFDRTAQGNAKPRGVIRIAYGAGGGRIDASPPRGLFTVVVKPRNAPPGVNDNSAKDVDFVGVWSIDDRGDAPPRWMIGGPGGVLQWIFGSVLDPKHKTVIIADMRLNAVVTFSFPEIF